jgi:hypothetical protein
MIEKKSEHDFQDYKMNRFLKNMPVLWPSIVAVRKSFNPVQTRVVWDE